MVELLIANWRVILLAAVIGWAGVATKLWREEARAFRDYKVQEEAKTTAAEQQHAQTLKDVSDAWQRQLPAVRNGAVAVYCRTHACGVPAVPTAPGGEAGGAQGADGTGKECVAGAAATPDPGFVSDCAEDALKINLWQSWATENQLPVK